MLFVSKKTLPDTQLIQGIAEGGSPRRRYENQLFEKYHNLTKEGVRKHRLSEDECVSAYSDTIMSVIDSIVLGRFEGRSELKTYIYQIFMNKCVDQIRKNTTNKASVHDAYSIDDLTMQFSDESRTVIQQMVVQSEIDKLHKALDKIGEKCKQMILAWGEGYSDEEIATQLEYNSPAVAKTSRLRCLEKLKGLM
jgi:RNA polymerase sigma factor (sigma-70 family)